MQNEKISGRRGTRAQVSLPVPGCGANTCSKLNINNCQVETLYVIIIQSNNNCLCISQIVLKFLAEHNTYVE